MIFMKSDRRTFRTRSTKYSSSQGAAKAKWPLKMTRSKQESTATIKLVNLATKCAQRLHGVLLWNGAGANPILKEERRFFRSLFGCGYAALGDSAKLLGPPIDTESVRSFAVFASSR